VGRLFAAFLLLALLCGLLALLPFLLTTLLLLALLHGLLIGTTSFLLTTLLIRAASFLLTARLIRTTSFLLAARLLLALCRLLAVLIGPLGLPRFLPVTGTRPERLETRRAMGKGRNRCDHQKKGNYLFGCNRPENGHAPLDDSRPWCRRFVARRSFQCGRPTEIWSGRGAGSGGLRGDVRQFPTFVQTPSAERNASIGWPAQRWRCAHRTARCG